MYFFQVPFVFMIWLMVLVASVPTLASTWALFGIGAQNISLGNATAALPTDGFSQMYNPSLSAVDPKDHFSLGIQGNFAAFNSINQVVVDSPQSGGTSYTVGDVNTKTPDSFLVSLGYQRKLFEGERNWYLGFYLVIPAERLLTVDTQDDFLPQYSLYLNDSQRLNTGVTLSHKINENWSLGGRRILFFRWHY